jgi:hypothetical protein
LYPSVQKHGIFPLGNPQVFTAEKFKNVIWEKASDNHYTGFILATILCPADIKLPLLAYSSSNGNLVWAKCRSCADMKQSSCNHSEAEKAWTATYTHLELNEALDLGYKVLEIFEVWHYSKWSTPGGNADLFGAYVDLFVKEKVEASGWPVDGEKERQEYIDGYMQKENIKLDPSKICLNPGKRAVSKLMANSLCEIAF